MSGDEEIQAKKRKWDDLVLAKEPVAPFPRETTMFRYFLGDRQKEQAGNIALIDARDGSKMTYKEVHEQALGAAVVFKDHGLEIEQRAILMLKNVPELVTSFFGVQALGSVTTMAVPWLGMEKKEIYEHFLNYTRARIAVVPYSMAEVMRELTKEQKYLRAVFFVDDGDTGDKSLVEGADGPVKFVDFHKAVKTALDAKRHEDPAIIPADLCCDDIALWYFTSGTTSLPKGCVHVQHDMPYAAETYGKITMDLKASDVICASSPMTGPYAMGSNCLFPFSVGAACVLDALGPEMKADTLFDIIEKHRPTVCVTSPNFIRSMCDSERKDAMMESISRLRYITSAGDVLYASDYNKWKETFGVEILDGIGTSELQHIFISNTLEPGGVKPGSVGKRVPGYGVKVMDPKTNEEVAVGDVGELRVKGDSNSVMYWNQQIKTKSVFNGDWYDTGDLAYVDEDGFYFLCGRSTDLKSMFTDEKRDLRISPFRLEDELLSHAAVADCAVADVLDKEMHVTITAYVCLRKGFVFDASLEEQLKTYLDERVGGLGDKRLDIRALKSIPRNARDKVERTLLRDLQFSIFCSVDKDASGHVDRAELGQYLDSRPAELRLCGSLDSLDFQAMCDKYMAKFDSNQDQRLSFPEFREMLLFHSHERLCSGGAGGGGGDEGEGGK